MAVQPYADPLGLEDAAVSVCGNLGRLTKKRRKIAGKDCLKKGVLYNFVFEHTGSSHSREELFFPVILTILKKSS